MKLKDSAAKAGRWLNTQLKSQLLDLSPAELASLLSEYDAVHGTKVAEKYASAKPLRADEDPGFADFIEQNREILDFSLAPQECRVPHK